MKAIANEICPMIIDAFKLPPKSRSTAKVRDLVPHAKKLEFFKERELNDHSIADILNLMILKDMKKDEFVI